MESETSEPCAHCEREYEFPLGVTVLAFVVFMLFLGVMSWQAGFNVSGPAIGFSLAVSGFNLGKFYTNRENRAEKREMQASLREMRKTNDAARRRPTSEALYEDVAFSAEDVVRNARIRDPDAENPTFNVPQDSMLVLEDMVKTLRKSQELKA